MNIKEISIIKDETKSLIVDYGHGKASIEISPSSTFSDVRKVIVEEFDDDMFPNQDPNNWGFKVNDVRITSKQESRKLAWNYLDPCKVSIRSTTIENKSNLAYAYGAKSNKEAAMKTTKAFVWNWKWTLIMVVISIYIALQKRYRRSVEVQKDETSLTQNNNCYIFCWQNGTR